MLVNNDIFQLKGRNVLMLLQILKNKIFEIVFTVVRKGLDDSFLKRSFGLGFLSFQSLKFLMEMIQGLIVGIKFLGMLLMPSQESINLLGKMLHPLMEMGIMPVIVVRGRGLEMPKELLLLLNFLRELTEKLFLLPVLLVKVLDPLKDILRVLLDSRKRSFEMLVKFCQLSFFTPHKLKKTKGIYKLLGMMGLNGNNLGIYWEHFGNILG